LVYKDRAADGTRFRKGGGVGQVDAFMGKKVADELAVWVNPQWPGISATGTVARSSNEGVTSKAATLPVTASQAVFCIWFRPMGED
jgi:hypothetical protein